MHVYSQNISFTILFSLQTTCKCFRVNEYGNIKEPEDSDTLMSFWKFGLQQSNIP